MCFLERREKLYNIENNNDDEDRVCEELQVHEVDSSYHFKSLDYRCSDGGRASGSTAGGVTGEIATGERLGDSLAAY